MSYGKSYVLVSTNASAAMTVSGTGAAMSAAGAIAGAAAVGAALLVTGAGVMVAQGLRAVGELARDESAQLGGLSPTGLTYRAYSSDLLLDALPSLEQAARARHLEVVHDAALVLGGGPMILPLAVADGSGRCVFFVKKGPRGEVAFLIQDGSRKADDFRQLEEVLVETVRVLSASRLGSAGLAMVHSTASGWLLRSGLRQDGSHDEVAYRYHNGRLGIDVDRFDREGQSLPPDQCPSIDDLTASLVWRPAVPHGPSGPPDVGRAAPGSAPASASVDQRRTPPHERSR